MATTLSIASPAGTSTVVIQDASTTRLVAAAKATRDGWGNMTNLQVQQALLNEWLGNLRSLTLGYESSQVQPAAFT